MHYLSVLIIGLSLSFSISSYSQSFSDQRVGGTVDIAKELRETYHDQGVLFISLRTYGKTSGPPLAVVRVERPKYPQAFVVGPQNAMIPGTVLNGPFQISARHSLKGDALDRGEDVLEATLKEKVSLGQRNILLKF